jgi:hypothetical protein
MRFDFGVSVRIRDAYRSQHEPEAQRILANVYWTALVLFFGAIFVACIGFGIWQFFLPLPPAAENAGGGVRKVFTKTDLIKILDAFEARSLEYQKRRAEPSPARDPS